MTPSGPRRLTVVIPTVRVDEWLDQAVDSVLASVDVDVDLLVVHDGVAPDESRGWMADDRVRIVHQIVRLGQAEAMRRGLEEAKHDLVARLDADDISLPGRLAQQSAYLDDHPDTVAVGSRVARISPAGDPLGEIRTKGGEDIRVQLLLENVVPHSSLMFRRRVGTDVGGYDGSLGQMEDYDFILRLAEVGPIALLDEVHALYRVHPAQTSRGAPPTGDHMRRVRAGRRRLRIAIGAPAVTSTAKHLVWVLVQYLRYWGARRPGYDL